MKHYRHLLVKLCLALGSVLFVFGAGKIYLRLIYGRVVILDDELGWRPTPNYVYLGFQKSIDGSSYYTYVSQDERGFRMFGNPASDKPKLFVIGDSATQATQVSDDKTYYALLGKRFNMEIFAYGIGGAGNLQEYMVFDKYFDEISPDLVLWQYCPNDFINNSYDLELRTRQNYNGMVRPYLEGDKIVYKLALPYPKIVGFLIQNSYLLRSLFGRIYAIQANRSVSVETEIEQLGLKHQGFKQAYQTTYQIMAMVKRRAGNTPIVAFDCFAGQPYHDAFREISAAQDIHFMEIDDLIAEGQKRGQVVLHSDGHSNEVGHALLAESISRYLEANGFVGQGRN